MAQKLYEESNIQAIADAIRSKNGTEDKYKTSEMSDAIIAIETAGAIESLEITSNGVYTAPDDIDGYSPITVNVPQDGAPPDSEFILTGDLDYRFAGAGREWTMKNHGHRYTTNKISRAFEMCMGSDLTEIPIEFNFVDGGGYCGSMFRSASRLQRIPAIDFAQTRSRDASYMFEHCDQVKEIGTMSNFYPGNISEMFRYCHYLKHLPKFENWNWTALHDATTGGDVFSSSYSLREIPAEVMKELYTKSSTGSYSNFVNGGYRYLYSMDELVGIIPYGNNYTSNMFTSTFSNGSRMKNITFALQEDGTPYVMTWRVQAIDLSPSKYIGYVKTYSYITGYNSGITRDKEVTDDTTYQALKNDPDWYTTKIEYSRYNHDSAVNTINSLPDTSAYVAGTTYTNTIKFAGASGSATDGGAINTLTEEEIAVATAKGWTVSMS